MKNIKLVVTDLDGTLLKNDKTISAYTLEVLKECRNKGIKIGFATARPIRGVTTAKGYFEPDFLIAHNGAVVRIGEEEQVFGITREEFEPFLQTFLEKYPSSELGIEANDIFFANYDVTKYWPDENFMRTSGDFSEFAFKYADKILISPTDGDFNEVRKWLPDSLYLEIADQKVGMIMKKEATKFNAIRSVAKIYGIPMEETVAFGDDDNDVLMIKGVGVGVAMENANEKVKAVSDEVTKSNESDGVALWLKKNVLEVE